MFVRTLFHSTTALCPAFGEFCWVDAGIDGINPIEYRVGIDPVKLREQYVNRLVCVGGLCNTQILPRGDRAELREHVQHLFDFCARRFLEWVETNAST